MSIQWHESKKFAVPHWLFTTTIFVPWDFLLAVALRHWIDWIAGDFIMFANSLFPVLHLVIHFGEISVSLSELENISDLL